MIEQVHHHDARRGFIWGSGLSLIILFAFFGGAWADRVFVVKPIDYFAARKPGQIQDQSSFSDSKLGDLLNSGKDMTVADVAEVASESVVTVSIKTQQRIVEPFIVNIPGFGPTIGKERTEQIQRDIGTGFVVDESGLIVTNKHVVSETQAEYKVIDTKNTEYAVTNIYRDPTSDLAILRVEGAKLPKLALGESNSIRVGEPVIAIGTALGEFRHTVTTGVISGLGRGITASGGFTGSEELENVIQTDAAINPGNSGGPLLNNKGQVIGVNVAVSANAQNIGFALPINLVKDSLTNFNQTGQFDRPFFGVRYQLLTLQESVGAKVPQGALVLEVIQNSSAAEAGMLPNDILIEIDGQSLTEKSTLAELINKKKIGDQLTIKYWREGSEKTATVTLRKAP
jgi:serine protease Do